MRHSTSPLISLADWLRSGHPFPLRWGDARPALDALWPGAQAELDGEVAAGYPFLELEGVEFYFEGTAFNGLCEICLNVWTWESGAPSVYVDYGWLHRGLTQAQVQAALQAQGVAYQVEPGPAFQTPNLRTAQGVLFAFYSDFEVAADAELMKVYLVPPQ